jgi:hypothetical protein
MNPKDVTVIEVCSLDEKIAERFPKPFAVQWADGSTVDCDTEEEACEIQRMARACNGLDEITGMIKLDKKKVTLDSLFQDYNCPLCNTDTTVNVEDLITVGSPFCPKCEYDGMVLVGDSYMKIIPEFIINELRMLTQKVTKYYESDFIRDENTLREYSEPFIWGCRESGTDLVLMPKYPFEKPDESYIIWINGENNKRSKEIRYFDGYSLEKITAEQAQRIWQDYCRGK